MDFQRHTLSNGIRIVHCHTQGAVAHCGIVINTGSRDERADQQGLAHFIEHVLFKGTSKRKAYHVLSCLENVGGELNAYTTKEETCIHASFLPGDYARAVELIADIHPQIASLLSETPLSQEQSLNDLPGSDWQRLHAKVPLDRETLWWIFGLNDHIRVHSPLVWADEIRQRLQSMQKLYQSTECGQPPSGPRPRSVDPYDIAYE